MAATSRNRPRAWGVGLHEYEIQAHDLWQKLLGREADDRAIRVAVTHQDQVVKKPAAAVVLADRSSRRMARFIIPTARA